jgi:hypothetical protein
MKYAALLLARHDPGLLPDLTAELRRRRLFPEQFHSDACGNGEVQIRLVLDCDDEAARVLRHYCETVLYMRSVVIVPTTESETAAPN